MITRHLVSVGLQICCSIIEDPLGEHPSGTAVGVELYLPDIPGPLGIQFGVFRQPDRIGVAIGISGAVVPCVPTNEDSPIHRETVRPEDRCFIIEYPLRKHCSGAAIAIECDLFNFLVPLGIQSGVAFKANRITVGI